MLKIDLIGKYKTVGLIKFKFVVITEPMMGGAVSDRANGRIIASILRGSKTATAGQPG